jgi:hypothetical protein
MRMSSKSGEMSETDRKQQIQVRNVCLLQSVFHRQGSEILSKFSLPKSMKHTVCNQPYESLFYKG